jgi:nucleoid DNA-binding protein
MRRYLMNKMGLIQTVHTECKLTKIEAAAVVELFFGGMADALANGGRVEIRGLWSIFVRE